MRILALETSALSGSAAALEGDEVRGEVAFDSQRRTAQTFAPGIAALLANIGWQPHDVRLIAVTHGPGSFTGLRVGVTIAKTLAYAVGAEVLGVNTLKVIAAQAPRETATISAVLNAQRGELFCGRFQRTAAGVIEAIEDPAIIDAEVWLQTLDDETLAIGPGLARLADRLPPDRIAPVELWNPRAVTVGQLACSAYQAGARDDFWKLAPLYYRPSAAEEKWAARDAAT
jgi:tRNA threonylcarbamoyladenosine biosynthesis protein TsaB